MGSYVFRWPYPAKDVHITGTFDDWGKSIQMEKVGDHWEKEVDLPSADEKVLYKFIVDDEWILDDGQPKEGDGHYNTNNVLMPDKIKRKPTAAKEATGIPGAFPETPSTEQPSFGVLPIPASTGIGNPIHLPPGAPVPDQKDITPNTVDSTVTTSKEDYDKHGGASTSPPAKEATEYSINPLPASSGTGNPISIPAGEKLPPQSEISSNTIGSAVTTSKEDYEKAGPSAAIPQPKDEQTFSVNPIPASSGVGNPISVPAGEKLPPQSEISSNTIGSAVTTSKEDYEKAGPSAAIPQPKEEQTFTVNPIPASTGIGNPITLAPGAPIPDQKEITPHTIGSTVTTSEEDYEKAGSSAFPAFAAAGAAAGVAGAAAGGAALAGAFSTPKDKNIIPESSLPMGAGNTIEPNPFISSSGPGTTTADLASKVPLETNPAIRSSGPGTTTADLASKVPLESDPTIRSSGPGTTTADLASKVPVESDPFKTSAGPDKTTSQLASDLEVPLKSSPFISSSGPGTTTADLAAKVPQENDPFVRSSGPGTTTAALAAAVPLETSGVPDVVKESISTAHQDPEAAVSSEAVKEKADLEKELLSKTHPTQATGESASAAADQTSYYGLATTVPGAVEKSMQEAHAAPEAAAETSAVAEKSAMEKELLSKIPSTDEAGEPAPTLAAATSTTAPVNTTATTTSATAAASSVTDGKTANEPVPDTDTSSGARGHSAGEIAGGAVVGSAAAAGTAALVARHKDADVEPARVPDSTKPDITTEKSPATAIKDEVPIQSGSAAATTETPALAEEPAVKLMKQNESAAESSTPIETTSTVPAAASTSTSATPAGLASTVPAAAAETTSSVEKHTAPEITTKPVAATTAAVGQDASSTLVEAGGVPSLTSAAVDQIKVNDTKEVVPPVSTTAPTETNTPATPVKKTHTPAAESPAVSTTTSSATEKKKKRHRISAFIKKVFD